jgi:hypothetical protein
MKNLLDLGHPADITFYILSLHVGLSLVNEERVMTSSMMSELDLIEELRLRRWAREHYVPCGQRQHGWHPVVHDEMLKKDRETGDGESNTAHYAWLKS